MLKKKSKECRSFFELEPDDPETEVTYYCELLSGHDGPHQELFKNYDNKGRWLKISWQNRKKGEPQ